MRPSTCKDCNKPIDQPSTGGKKIYCAECLVLHRQARQRTDFKRDRECERCGGAFEAYKGDQKYCRDCAPIIHANAQKQDDPQMERLFRSYDSRGDIEIDARPDGTRVLILSDAQIPFVDEPFMKAILSFTDTYRPHDIIFNGDWIDCYEVSDFDKNPKRKFGIKDELEQAESSFYDFGKRLAKSGRMFLAEGNHEERLRRYIWRHAGEIADIVPDLSSLLHLDTHMAGSVPYGKAIEYLGFTVTHGNYVSAYSAYTARKHADRYQSSGCNGHTHRAGSYSWRDGKGRSHTWYEIGCTCRLDLEYVKGVANWQQALLIGEVRNGALHPQLIRVIETDKGRGFFAAGQYWAIE